LVFQWDSVASGGRRAEPLAARSPVINAVAVAYVPPERGAEEPYRVLNEAGKGRREVWIELTGIDQSGEVLDDLSAPSGSVAALPIRVLGIEPSQDAGSVQVSVHKTVYGYEACARGDPPLPVGVSD
jgi:hypothetical protein